jgi:hypothetical protein
LKWATTNGARALGFETTWKIVVSG